MTENTSLKSLRSEIEQVTLDVVDLIGRRMELSRKVAREKARTGTALVNREVEQQLRKQVLKKSEDAQIDSKFALRLLNQLIIESIRTQKEHITSEEIPNAYTILLKARRMEQTGKEIIHLEVGEPDFGPPASVVDALNTAVKQGRTRYTESSGILELREKIANRINQQHDTGFTSENVMVAVGGRFALSLSVDSRISLGGEVVIIDPSYPGYADFVRKSGGKPVHISTKLENDWNPDLGELEDSINQSTQMIILNNPSNPTGKSLSKSTIEKIVELAISNDIQIVSDEVYSNFVFSSKTSILEFPDSNHVYLDSFSKTYGMTGFRLGYAVSDPETIRRITRLQNLYLTCASEFIQYAGVTAIDCKSEAQHYVELIEKRRKVICTALEDTELSFYRPDGGFYVFPKLEAENQTSIEFADKLLSEKGVAIVPGNAYGSQFSQFFRISLCQPEEQLIEAVKLMKEVLR